MKKIKNNWVCQGGGKLCAYCGVFTYDPQKEHVFARQIFRIQSGNNNVKAIVVPSCYQCNHNKSLDENYVVIALSMASDHAPTQKQLDTFRSWSKKRRETIMNAKPTLIYKNGVWQCKMSCTIDWESFKNVIKYIARGIIYEHNGNIPNVNKQYSICTVAAMPESSEIDVGVNLNLMESYDPTKIFRDNNRYGGCIKYAAAITKEKAIIYFQVYEPLLYSSITNKFSKIFAVSLKNN